MFAGLSTGSFSHARASEGWGVPFIVTQFRRAHAEAIRQANISNHEPEIFRRSDQVPSDGDRCVMNDIDDDRDELAFAQLDLVRYLSLPCSWSRPCAEAVHRDGPTRSTPPSTRWCTVRSARHRPRWLSKRSNRERLVAGTR